ncbi:hypothetical protein [Pedobacter kyonggii]|uniref:Serine protease n=1 Tax=Pedobacter kyonggii TaxID=1926871 RepID=A0A4Q9HG89_9SPHI|nr:hypothetical protein [Pedobacter kyonggii]TBO44253.1 hypothetical protein EYS08_02785 [Pedobacter kyonggii]
MSEELLLRTTVRVSVVKEGTPLSRGSGILVRTANGFLVFTAYHCVFGDEDQFIDTPIDWICIESQSSYNADFVKIEVQGILDSHKEEDWAVLNVGFKNEDNLFPEILNVKNFQTDTPVSFKGFQAISPDQGRTFKARVLDGTSNKEFRITLAKNDTFKGGADDARGLSGSGAFIIREGRLYFIGILKSVNGEDAANNDIKCCPVCCIDKYIDFNISDIAEDASFDEWGRNKFGEITPSDVRDLLEKITAVNPEISQLRINQYCRELALGKDELSFFQERDLSAIKYRVFEACQSELIDFVETNGNTQMLVEDINALIDRFTKKAIEIIKVKSQRFKYPVLDDDLFRKIILELINDCYLSFDKEGVYAE